MRCNLLLGPTLAAIAVLVFLNLTERGAHKKLRRALEDDVRELHRELHRLPFPCTERGQVMTQVSPLIASNLRPDASPLVAGVVRLMPPVRVAACTAAPRGETKREPPDAVSLATGTMTSTSI